MFHSKNMWVSRVMFILSVVVMAMVFTTSALADGGDKKKPIKKNKGAPDGFIVKCETGHSKDGKPYYEYIYSKGSTPQSAIEFCNGRLGGQVKGVQPYWWGKHH